MNSIDGGNAGILHPDVSRESHGEDRPAALIEASMTGGKVLKAGKSHD
ncbi:hypothetical protein [Hoeflea alexandrii]|nr:hypothetical protein [Hoeflea alexandrii]MCZ4289501.1 hypothetical protein [Hoeflea alexandrii]